MKGGWPRLARVASGAFVIAVVLAIAALTAAQRADTANAWIELSRYLPYYWLAAPCALACVLAAALGRRWFAASLCAPLLLATLTTGLEWHGAVDEAGHVRLMTYNSKLFAARPGSAVFRAVQAEVAAQDPDILVMQDAEGLLVGRAAPPLDGGPPLFGLPNVYALGQYVVASRLPLRGCTPGWMDFPGESHRFLRCAFDAHGTELTVVTAHFVSPRTGLIATRRAGIEGAGTWERNFENRLTQSQALAAQLAQMPRPLVVAGDLNAPESSPVVRQLLATGLRDSFSAVGRGHGFSYGQAMRAGLSFLRIDHVLASPDIAFARSIVGGGTASEHRPVIADLLLRRSP